MVKVFLSYHHKDRKSAARVKECLSGLGMNVFMAHEDLEPSTDWQKEILKTLKGCDVFIPLLTRNFRSSLWTDQETGIALAHKKRILPLKISSDPYGFIGKFQALKLRKELEDACWKIVRNLVSPPALGDRIRDGLIGAFLESGSFDESKRRADLLEKLKPFSSRRINRIVEGAATNTQIYGGRAARAVVKRLIETNTPGPRKSLIRKFEKRVESWPWP